MRPAPHAKIRGASQTLLTVVRKADRSGTHRGSAGLHGPGQPSQNLSFREIYERWFDHVTKWMYALGVPTSDTEDLTQEVFLVVRRRLPQFDGGNVAAWLYRITDLTVRDHRRRAWFRNLMTRRREIDLTAVPHGGSSPERTYEIEQNRRRFHALIAGMSAKRRATFVLFEVEGYSGEEIAQIQDIPLGTVWTRLHHARKEFWRLLKEQRRREANEP